MKREPFDRLISLLGSPGLELKGTEEKRRKFELS